MGCGASAAKVDEELRQTRLQVNELKAKLSQAEEERSNLKRRLEAREATTTLPDSPISADATGLVAESDAETAAGCAKGEFADRAASSEALTLPGVVLSAADEKRDLEVSPPAQEPLVRQDTAVKSVSSKEAPDVLQELSLANEDSVMVETSEVERTRLESTALDMPPTGAKELLSNSGVESPSVESADGCSGGEGLLLAKGGELQDSLEVKGRLLATGTELADSLDSQASTCIPKESTKVPRCNQCQIYAGADTPLHTDAADNLQYCEKCWIEYYGVDPGAPQAGPLVNVIVKEVWMDDRVAKGWHGHLPAGWPPRAHDAVPLPLEPGKETWSQISIRVRRHVVGSYAREQRNNEYPYHGKTLMERYRCERFMSEGHFTKAYLAEDLLKGSFVCLKRHRNLNVESLSDLMVLGKRMDEVDPEGTFFPKLIDAFYDLVGFTVESLIEGQNCLSASIDDPALFMKCRNLRHVARGGLKGLELLERAGIVHNDVKPDNIIWVPSELNGGKGPTCKLVDFGCARLDQREDPGRNWGLFEGGAGHLGKWSPEMVLRLPITHVSDVWGIAISVCELHCSRFVWRNEADTAEIVFAQSLGLCGYTEGVPSKLLGRSPLDIRQLYTPGPRHWPLRRDVDGRLEALQPAAFGLQQVLGDQWREVGKGDLGDFLSSALVLDPLDRPTASDLLCSCAFLADEENQVMQSDTVRSDLSRQIDCTVFVLSE